MSINKGATGSPSLSKTKGSLAGATRKSAGRGEVFDAPGMQHSAGLACVVAIRHPQVFSFPSYGHCRAPPGFGPLCAT